MIDTEDFELVENEYFTHDDCMNLDMLRSALLLQNLSDDDYMLGENVFMSAVHALTKNFQELMLSTSAKNLIPTFISKSTKPTDILTLLRDSLVLATTISYILGVEELNEEAYDQINTFVEEEHEGILESPYLCVMGLMSEVSDLTMEHLFYSQLGEEELGGEEGMDLNLASLGLLAGVARLAASMELSVEEVIGIY